MNNSSGYTVAGGIEKFDVVNLDYVLSNNDSIIGNIFGSPVFQAVMGILVIGVIYVKSIGK